VGHRSCSLAWKYNSLRWVCPGWNGTGKVGIRRRRAGNPSPFICVVPISLYCWHCSSQLDLSLRPRHFNLRVASKELPKACGDSGADADSRARAAATMRSIRMCREENTLLKSLSPKWSLLCWLLGNTSFQVSPLGEISGEL